MIDTDKIEKAIEEIEKLTTNNKIKKQLDIIKSEMDNERSRRIDAAYAAHAGDRSYW